MRPTMYFTMLIAVTFVASPLSAQDAAEKPAAPANPLTDTSVYPVAVWAMGARTAPAFADMGVNVFVGESGNALTWCNDIAKSGCRGCVHWRERPEAERQAIVKSPGFLGWMHGDEPDNPGVVDGEFRSTRIPPKVLIDRYEAMRKSSTAAPMYLNLGVGLAVGSKQTTPDATYREFMKCADVVCYDVYPVSTHNHGASRLHLVARGMSHLKGFAGPGKPAWIWLECTAIGGEKPGIGFRVALPHELRAEIWMSILHGADGIGYFPHQFSPYKGGPAAIPQNLQQEMKLSNALLHKLAPVLRTGAKQMLKVDAGNGRVDAAQWTRGDEVLVVAVNMRNAPAKAVISLGKDVKEFTVVGQNLKAKPKGGKVAGDFQPYEVRLFYTGPQITNQSYRYPAPASAAEARAKDVRIDFEGDLPEGSELKGEARVADAMAHGGKKALHLGEMGEVTIPLTDEDFRGRVTMWIYDSSKKHSADDPDKPAVGPTWGLQDSQGRMMLFGIIRRSFLGQQSYSYVFTNRLRGYPSPGYANMSRTKPGWYKWEFDLTKPGAIAVLVNGKPISGIGDNYGNFDKGFNAIKIVGGSKGEFEAIVIDDIQVEYPGPREEKPGKLADLPFARDNRKSVEWCRTHQSRVAAVELDEAPKIDGDLTDPGWINAETLGTWTNTGGSATASYQTVGVVGVHGGKLYMAFRCKEDFLDDLVTDKKAHWQNDCIEIFLDPDNRRTSHAHIIVTAAGDVSATRLVPDEWGEGRRDDQWRPKIEAKTGCVKNGWTLEVAIDLKDLGDVRRNAVWGFDVARERKPERGENSVYTLGGFQEAFYFGELAFGVTGVTLADGKLRNRSDEPATAMVQVLISEPEAGKQFPAWEQRWHDVARETIVYALPPKSSRSAGGLSILQRDLMLKVPDGGRIQFALRDKSGKTILFEEFIARTVGAVPTQ